MTTIAAPDAWSAAEWRAELERRFPSDPSLVIPVLQHIHQEAGYLPEAAMEAAAEHLRVSSSHVFGVASFYSQFHFEPRGAHTITVCRGTACHVRGSGAILRGLEDHLGIKAGGTTPDLQQSLDTVACVGSCALAPVVISDGRVQGHQTTATARAIADTLRGSAPTSTVHEPPPPPAGSVRAPAQAGPGRVRTPADLELQAGGARDAWQALRESDRAVITVGTATCGLAAGAGSVVEALRAELGRLGNDTPVIEVGCLGLCFAEPIVEIRTPGLPAVTYQQVTPAAVGSILDAHVVRGEPSAEHALATDDSGEIEGIPRLAELPVMHGQVRVALRNCGVIDPTNVDHYLARGGYAGLRRALGLTPEEVVAEVKASGLRGRGGAGFPTATKWEFCRASPSEPKYLICNADEGDPGAFMDRSLLEGDPHAVLEGMAVAAYAIGARHGYIYVRAEYPLAVSRLQIAIGQMQDLGLLGEEILGSEFAFDVELKLGAGAFVCGEETALMASIEGRRGMPRPRPPFPAVKGLFGQPSNINNVETLANVSSILREGADWYAGFGTTTSKGTKTFALTGKVARPGLIEVPMGITLGEVVRKIGGGIARGGQFKAAQTGGPSGGCIPASMADLPIDYEQLRDAGSIMGSGGLVIMDQSTCMVDLARYFLTFTQDESCGQCTPCREGTGRMLEILERICRGEGRPEDLPALEALGRTIAATSLCGLGQTAPNPVLTTLRYFRDEYIEHIERRHCRAGMCPGLVVAPCTHLCPAGVEAHRYVRLVSQGNFEDAYLVVREKLPLPSVCGVACYHPCELSCKRGDLDERVAVRTLKDAAVRFGGQAEARIPVAGGPVSGRSVAVLGSGPDGLAAAYYLARLGRHDVTVFETLGSPGGILRYHPPDAGGVPQLRKPSPMVEALDRDLDIIRSAGVAIQTDSPVYTLAELREHGYDAIFISATARASYLPEVPARGPDDGGEPMTALEGVFGGRESAFGPASAVEAIANGREMAQAIDLYLGGGGDMGEHLAPAEVLSELPPLPVETGQRFRPSRSSDRRTGGAPADHGYSIEDALEEASRCLRCDLNEVVG